MSFVPANRILNFLAENDGTSRKAPRSRAARLAAIRAARRAVAEWMAAGAEVVRLNRLVEAAHRYGQLLDEPVEALARESDAQVRAAHLIRRACGLTAGSGDTAALVLADGRIVTALPHGRRLEFIEDGRAVSRCLVLADAGAVPGGR